MEKLNQRCKLKEKLCYPLKICDDLSRAHLIIAGQWDVRIKHQRGAFILPCVVDTYEKLLEMNSEEIIKHVNALVIPEDQKSNFLNIINTKYDIIREKARNEGVYDVFWIKYILGYLMLESEDNKARIILMNTIKKKIHESVFACLIDVSISVNGLSHNAIAIRIPHEYKKQIRDELEYIGFSKDYIYPGIDNLSQRLLSDCSWTMEEDTDEI